MARSTIPTALAGLVALHCATASKSAPEPSGPDVTQVASPAQVSAYQNNGGMWMPKQLPARAAQLKAFGLELDPGELASPLSPPLAAIVSLGGCSASFVSPTGLIITNHHCVTGYLQYHSTRENNLVELGFLAESPEQELSGGPTARVYVTQKSADVTDQILAGVDGLSDDRERFEMIERREKDLLAKCEAERPHVRCRVASYFRGATYYLIEMLQIRDVRLVYAPEASIGNFGGDEDNWMWPRHTGDFAFLRAYVGPDGKPADHSRENLPYRPPHHLKVASSGVTVGDFVMVTGYPGGTHRHKNAAEVLEAVEWDYPRSIQRYEELLTVLREVSARDPEAAIKAQQYIRGIENGLKNNRGMLDGLVKGGLAERRVGVEAHLRDWIEATPDRRKRYGDLFPRLDEIYAARKRTRARDDAMSELWMASLLGTATAIVRMAEERPKPDAERNPAFQERNWRRREGRMKAMERYYHRGLMRDLFVRVLQRAARDPEANRDWLSKIVGPGGFDDASIATAVDRLMATTKLEDTKTRLDLFRTATVAKLRELDDGFIRVALALRPLQEELEERKKREVGALALLRPRYLAALREQASDVIAPDANGTLRVTYGTVRGYSPRPGAALYEPFTTLTQLLAKDRGAKPFAVPAALKAAAQTASASRYFRPEIGDVPLDFLADLDITGGNSGSATLNGRGELVGLAFDGNYESIASDWLFIPRLTRSIHVDIRYVLWVMDAVDGAHHLLRELGVEPTAAR